MNCNKSLLSRDCSIWLKGFLTVLIIMGHDIVLTTTLQEYGFMSFLYMFHIQSFFILPFLYGIKKEAYTWRRFEDTVTRFYWPYFWLVILMMFCYGIFTKFTSFTWGGLIHLFLFCDTASIKQMCGIQIFWFLPCMLSMMFLKELFYRSGTGIRFFLLFVSSVFVLGDFLANSSYQFSMCRDLLLKNLPLESGYAMQLLAQGVLLRTLIEYMEDNNLYRKSLMISLIGFLISCMLYVKYVAFTIGTNDMNMVYALLQNITPLIFLIMVVSILKLTGDCSKMSNVKKLGNRSLYVYLISPFVGYVAYFVCIKLNIVNLGVGLFLCPLIVYISYEISLIVKGKLEIVLFPKKYKP